MQRLLVFTDGGAFKRDETTFRAVSSYRILSQDKDLIHRHDEITEIGTSPFAEIKAIELALENVCEYINVSEETEFEVHVFTDSMLCISSLTQWIFGWIKNAKDGIFQSSKGYPVLNQKEIKQAFAYLNKIRNSGTINFYHINSHIARKNVDKLKEKFQKKNKITLSKDDFLFIYLQNAKCDKSVKEAHDRYIENKKTENNIVKEEIIEKEERKENEQPYIIKF